MQIDTAKPCITGQKASAPSLDGVRVLALFAGDEMFGQELATIEVFRHMAALALKVKFVTSCKWGHKKIQPELERHGFEWTTAPFGYHWTKYMFGRHFGYLLLNIYGVVATSLRVFWEVWRWKPTHIFAGNWIYLSYAFPVVWFLQFPLVYRAGDELPIHTPFHRWFTRKLMRRADFVVCISRFIQKSCIGAGVAFEKTRVIYNFPPKRLLTSVPALPPAPQDAVVLIYLGQVSERKGVVVLLDAVERMIRKGSNIVLWVVGDPVWGEEWPEVFKRRLAAEGLSDRIAFVGYIQNVNYVLSRADIHVCPSLYSEALSNVVPEAKLSGKPSVVFPMGGLPELIDHCVDGYVCRDQTVEALVEGIEFFVTNAAVRRAAGEAARRSLEEKFGEERFRREWADVFVPSAVREHG